MFENITFDICICDHISREDSHEHKCFQDFVNYSIILQVNKQEIVDIRLIPMPVNSYQKEILNQQLNEVFEQLNYT